MGFVNADSSAILEAWQSITNAVSSIEATKISMMQKYKQLGIDWNDKKYRELGDIVQECNKALNNIMKTLLQGEKYLVQLFKSIQEYESISFNGTSGGISPSINRPTEIASLGGQDSSGIRCLEHTQQEHTTVFLNGRNCSVFDHPFQDNPHRICNQGSAYPSGPQNTCGCCSSGTIVNRAGGSTNEHDIVAVAWDNGLCDNDGFMSANTISGLLTRMGVPSTVTSGSSLSDLAVAVEQGQGVIIAVDARRFDPSLYRRSGGHAMVLESVIRDASTNEILGYVVVDSNRETTLEACRRIDARQLERAFRALGNQSITTNNIIW